MKSISYSIIVDTNIQKSIETFIEIVWYGLGFQTVPLLKYLPGAGIVKEGDANGVGCIRSVPGKWCPMVKEEILQRTENTIIYTLRSGPFPASEHKGIVLFEQNENSEFQTKITWTVEYIPYCCCNAFIRFFVWVMFPNALKAVKQAVSKNVQKDKTT